MLSTQVMAFESDEEIIHKLYRNSYTFWQEVRNDNGTFQDGYHFDQISERGSIANVGMGLIATAIAHANCWEPDAEKMALHTLNVVAGRDSKISVPRNKNGTYIHFYNTTTGEQVGDDWSPVDSAIMLKGAQFIKNYFSDNKEIAEVVDYLFESTDLTSFIASVEKGQIWLSAYEDGSFVDEDGTEKHKTLAFNEYMIVASIAYQQALRGMGADAAPDNDPIAFWNKWYETTDNVHKPVYETSSERIEVLGVNPNWFISKFNFQFNNYLVHHYSNSDVYQSASHNAARADFAWWNDQASSERESYEWGSGAGSCPQRRPDGSPQGNDNKYCVDRIRKNGDRSQNESMVVSPHILAGFMPQLDSARDDLIAMYRDDQQQAHYRLEDGSVILWRYSLDHPEWRAKAIQAVDFSTMLFGLAALEENLGMEFFNKYNHYYDF
ncbi:hypothetical protein [Endozoicomonas lisbonensis]